jgi:hypothetical protein
MDNNPPRKICSKGHCKIILPSGTQFKQCDTCRERERQLQKASRARKKAANEKITPVGRKRPREAGQAPDERPARRARSNGAEDARNAHDPDQDEDDDGNFEKVHVINNTILTNSNLTLGS